MKNTHLIPWLIAAGTLCVALWLLLEKGRLHKQLAERQDSELLRLRADDAFCNGDLDQALHLYGELAARTGDSVLLLQRAERRRAMAQTNLVPDTVLQSNLAELEQQNDLLQIQLREHAEERRRSEAHVPRQSEGRAATDPQDHFPPPPAPVTSLVRMKAGKKNDEVIYLGGTRNGKAHGYGIGVWRSGSIYEGDWQNGQRHGTGVFQWADGERYEGHYQNDVRTGQGTYHWQNGQRWTGEWNDDMRNGIGVLYEPSGKVRVEGTWQKDRLLSSSKAQQRTRKQE